MEDSGSEKYLNSLNGASWAIPAGAWETAVLRAIVGYDDLAEEVSEEKIFRMLSKDCSCKDMAVL